MWSGTIASIPSGWVLCNGSNSTPDLRNRFIIGAHSDTAGVAYSTVTGSNTQSGGSKDAVVVSHTHTASSSVSDPGHSHNFNERGDDGQGGPSLGYSVVSYNANDGAGGGMMSSATTGISVATTVNSTGSSGTNANVQPYITVRMWKRVS
jgi:hypothetical protein